MNSLPQSQVATPLMQQQQVQPMYGMANAGQNVVNPQQYTAQQLLGLQAQVRSWMELCERFTETQIKFSSFLGILMKIQIVAATSSSCAPATSTSHSTARYCHSDNPCDYTGSHSQLSSSQSSSCSGQST